MAHADYDCCAICDEKLHYNHDADAKGEICSACAVEFYRETGEKVVEPMQLREWIINTETDTVSTVLLKLSFRQCYYANEIDDVVTAKCGDLLGAR